MRVITALALVVVNVGLGWAVTAGPAAADPVPGVVIHETVPTVPLSECYTVALNPPTEVKPSVTLCQP